MGLIKPKTIVAPSLPHTPLDVEWFKGWIEHIFESKGDPKTQAAVADLCTKAVAVIDHDCVDYVERYCDGRAQDQYRSFLHSEECKPWSLISLVVGLNSKPGWQDFIINDMQAKLARFAEIVIDPSVVQ